MSDTLDALTALAHAAGRAALRHYGAATATYKDAASPVTAADHAANDVIVAGLRERFPRDAILSEESADSADRLAAGRVWIVDPLDGTKEFLAQNGEFSIMIGLAVDGVPQLGVVYLPAADVLYAAEQGRGAWVERAGGRSPLRCSESTPSSLRMVGSRSHPDALLVAMQAALAITDVRPSGSVGIKCALIAEARCDLYIHPVPYLREWDTCAPEIILREAGGVVTDCRGRPLRYNKPDPVQPDGILACTPSIQRRVLAAIQPLYEATYPRRVHV